MADVGLRVKNTNRQRESIFSYKLNW